MAIRIRSSRKYPLGFELLGIIYMTDWTKEESVIERIENVSTPTRTEILLYFFPNVRLFILSSKIAATEHISLQLSDILRPISVRGTSTICTATLPSRTLLTLSTSIFLEDEDPMTATQKAPPRCFNSEGSNQYPFLLLVR